MTVILHQCYNSTLTPTFVIADINWRGHILSMNLRFLRENLALPKLPGVVLDVVIPSFRTNNNAILGQILALLASVQAYVKFWVIVDNPLESHVAEVNALAETFNQKTPGNYFVNVIHYGANRGASYARNTGYNYSTADWCIFLDDDIVPSKHLLDAYIGSIHRYPHAEVFVGCTHLPEANNLWTKMLKTCNVGYFYGIAETMVNPCKS